MTSNKRFKRRVRRRAATTGEPYTTARLRLTRGEHTGEDGISLETYLDDIRAMPTVGEAEERALLERARAGDALAGRTVVMAFLARTADIALELAPQLGLEDIEALGEANLALMQLVDSEHETLSGALDDEIVATLQAKAEAKAKVSTR